MTRAGFDVSSAIQDHSSALAEVARGRLHLPVPSCPGWNVADLVAHVTEVQWFWATIVEDRLPEPPPEGRRPPRAADADLLPALRSQTTHLLDALRGADLGAHVWTWAPAQQNVGFIARHQVQEAAVHHWDAAHAAHQTAFIEPAVAADAIDEFLTFSVSSDADPADPPRPPLEGRFVLRCTDLPQAWTISDGRAPGTVRFARGAAPGVATIYGSAADLLLWLYRRVALDTGAVPAELLMRFAGLTFTD